MLVGLGRHRDHDCSFALESIHLSHWNYLRQPKLFGTVRRVARFMSPFTGFRHRRIGACCCVRRNPGGRIFGDNYDPRYIVQALYPVCRMDLSVFVLCESARQESECEALKKTNSTVLQCNVEEAHSVVLEHYAAALFSESK